MKKQLITLIFVFTLLGGCDILKELELPTSIPLTTSEVVQGLKEEKLIRNDPKARVTEILKRVFGSASL